MSNVNEHGRYLIAYPMSASNWETVVSHSPRGMDVQVEHEASSEFFVSYADESDLAREQLRLGGRIEWREANWSELD